jgi:hypothetical protein
LLLIHIKTNARVAFAASAASSARHIERNGYQVADIDEEHILALLNDFAQDLVPKNNSLWRSRAAADHVLVRPANVCGHNFQNDAVFNGLALGILEYGIVDGVYFHLTRTLVYYATITCRTVFSISRS